MTLKPPSFPSTKPWTPRGTLIDRFWAKVWKESEAECWVWTGCKIARGYGRLLTDVPGKVDYAHRISWRLHFGDIPEGIEVCHRCNRPSCVNPKHLYLATHTQNMKDAKRDGILRGPEGPRNHNCKLTQEQVERLRGELLPGEIEYLAEKFGVTVYHAWRVHTGRRRWKP